MPKEEAVLWTCHLPHHAYLTFPYNSQQSKTYWWKDQLGRVSLLPMKIRSMKSYWKNFTRQISQIQIYRQQSAKYNGGGTCRFGDTNNITESTDVKSKSTKEKKW